MRIKPVNKFIKILSGLVFGKITGISLCPFGIYMDNPADTVTLNHEKIHWRQQIEMLILPFYIWYLAEFLIRRVSKSKKQAYSSISFEKEAYMNQNNLNYLKTRKPYSWIRRIM